MPAPSNPRKGGRARRYRPTTNQQVRLAVLAGLLLAALAAAVVATMSSGGSKQSSPRPGVKPATHRTKTVPPHLVKPPVVLPKIGNQKSNLREARAEALAKAKAEKARRLRLAKAKARKARRALIAAAKAKARANYRAASPSVQTPAASTPVSAGPQPLPSPPASVGPKPLPAPSTSTSSAKVVPIGPSTAPSKKKKRKYVPVGP